MIRRIIAVVLCIAMCMTLCSCSISSRSQETEPEIILPEPIDEQVNMFLGEQVSESPRSVVLHYVSADGTSFNTVTRNIVLSYDENIYEEAVIALLNTSGAPDRTALIPDETQLLNIEFSRGIVTVNLSLDVHGAQSEQEQLMLIASIVNTLLSIEGVEGVNVLIDGRSEGISQLPLGIQTQPFTGITPEYARISAERDYFLESATGTIVREAALYFPTRDGEWFVPELREISFDSDNYASALIRALRSGPQMTGCAVSAIPEGADLLVNNPVFEMTPSGERVLRLDFSSTLLNYLAFSGLEEWQLISSVVLTICSFVPQTDAVRMYIDDQLVTHYTIDDTEYASDAGLLRREDFSAFIGNTSKMFIPMENGTLEAVERAGSMVRTESPQSMLQMLLADFSTDGESPKAFAENIYRDDVLGVSVEDNVASVNLSANFYRQAQALDATAERGVIYAIVNTLCGLDGITGVRFYIEGISAETLSGSVYLKGVLLPNPGIVASWQSADPEFTAIP